MAEKKRIPLFETRRDMEEITYGGLFGGEPDTFRRMAPGLCHFYIDGKEVTEAEYVGAVEAYLKNDK